MNESEKGLSNASDNKGEFAWTTSRWAVAIGLALSLTYALVRWMSLSHVEPILFPDSEGYMAPFRDGIPKDPFINARSWGYLGFIWLTGHSNEAVIWVQRFLGIVCWLALAWSVFFLYRSYVSRFLSFASILFVSLSFSCIQWDNCILTESLTISFLVLSMSLAIWMRLLGRKGLFLVFPLIGCLVVLAGLRDGSIFILPVFAGAIFLGYLPGSIFAMKRRKSVLDAVCSLGPFVAAAAILVVGAVHFHWATVANRSWMTTANAITIRAFLDVNPDGVTVNQENVDLIIDKYGAPRAIVARTGKNLWEEPRDKDLDKWLEENGPRIWKSFLLTNPAWVWRIYTFYPSPYSRPYEQYYQSQAEKWGQNKPLVPEAVEQVLNSTLSPLFSWWSFHLALLVYLLIATTLWQIALWKRFSSPVTTALESIVITASIGAIIPLIALVGDAIEDWRHALTGLVALYVSLSIVVGCVVDGVLRLFWHSHQD